MIVWQSHGQTMFTAFKSIRKQADIAYDADSFREAAALYIQEFLKNPSREVNVRIARCHFFMAQYEQAAMWYEKYVTTYGDLPSSDKYYLAEAYASRGEYAKAVQWYNAVLSQAPDDMLVAKKVWRLRNIQYLYEDSLHYSIQALNINTAASELGAVPYKDGIIFLSNRESVQLVDNRDAVTAAPFYKTYYATFVKDTLGVNTGHYNTPKFFEKEFGSKFQEGAIAFFHGGKRMVYTVSSKELGKTGTRTLQLHFAELKEGSWIALYSFPYNSLDYSVTDPAISDDGTVLFFSSDMKGGLGGKDLFRSEYSNGQWSKPVNLVDINTPYDEAYPFLHNKRVLYFSSKGHPGMGGFDVFRADVMGENFSEVTNPGYPINTHYDDFSFVVDSLGIRGHLASNRNGPTSGDDIFSVDIDMQSYPLAIDGIIRYKEIGWKDSAGLKPLANARLILIDNLKEESTVYETVSDDQGNFVLHIPYFSQYKIKVIENDKRESIVSLEVPRHRKEDFKHEIVVVHDIFKSDQAR
jgi:tetratricopeptide (TPR) repeat protein